MLNPCCCITPRIGTFIFGVIDLIYAIGLVIECVDFILHRGLKDNYIWGKLALGCLLLFMALLLLIGAWRNAQDKIRLWLFMWAVYLIILIIFLVFDVYHSSGPVSPWRGSGAAFILLFIYEIWVVWAYLHELTYGPAGLTYCPTQIV